MTKSSTRQPRRRAVPTARAPESLRASSTSPSARSRSRTPSASTLLGKRIGKDPSLRAAVEQHKLGSRIAEMLLAARTHARLTQKALADLVGTTQSVISRLEDADYGGHSLTMLQRIADALGLQLDVAFTRGGKTAR